jgi:hypothetical protein
MASEAWYKGIESYDFDTNQPMKELTKDEFTK